VRLCGTTLETVGQITPDGKRTLMVVRFPSNVSLTVRNACRKTIPKDGHIAPFICLSYGTCGVSWDAGSYSEPSNFTLPRHIYICPVNQSPQITVAYMKPGVRDAPTSISRAGASQNRVECLLLGLNRSDPSYCHQIHYHAPKSLPPSNRHQKCMPLAAITGVEKREDAGVNYWHSQHR